MDLVTIECYDCGMKIYFLSFAHILVFTLFLGIFFNTSAVLAQASTAEPPIIGADKKDDSGNIDPTKLPDDYLQEYRKVLNDCRSTHIYNLYYDCGCYALRFLEKRVENGRGVPKQRIKSSLNEECRDATNAVGHEYNECLKTNTNMSAGTDPEELCACYANTYIRLVDSFKPRLQNRSLSQFKVRAKLQCKDPTAARRRYGNFQ